MTLTADTATINVLDPRGLNDLRRAAKTNDPATIKAAARQFEAMFLQMVLKSMREATPKSELFDNDQSRMYESLLDQPMAQVLSSKRGVGLADVIARQMQRAAVAPDTASVADAVAGTAGIDSALSPDARAVFDALRAAGVANAPSLGFGNRPAATAARQTAAVGAASTVTDTASAGAVPAHVRDFVARVLPDANAAAEETGIPAAFLVAHAALESGWGRYEARRADGSASHNLFGIKAGSGWSGDRVTANTVEYVQGLAQQRRETFRAYGSYAESFADYARLLEANPRYAGVLAARNPGEFAGGLQRAGYATDPAYSSKLEQVIQVASAALGKS